jgi:hypothetical protein
MDLLPSEKLQLFSQELQRLLSPVVLHTSLNKLALYSDLVSTKQTNSSPFAFGSAKKSRVHRLRNYVVG